MRAGFRFESVAKAYRLIDEDTVPVVVATWKGHEVEIESLLAAVRERPTRVNFRALAPFQVNVFRSELKRLPAGLAVPVIEDGDLYAWYGIYDPQVGRTSDSQNLLDPI